MAMAFAPVAMLREDISIDDPEVVKKSYPEFWKQLKSLNFEVKEK
jgi:3-phosphoshikimate 1-carboxyvinyltransferase